MVHSGEPMTFEDLTALYRMERKNTSLAEARKDVYPAITRLLSETQREYERQLSLDPDSIITDGLNERRKKMLDYSQRIVDLRMQKILILALRSAMGSDNTLERLTSEERDFYEGVLIACRDHRSLIAAGRRKEVRIPDILSRPEKPEKDEVMPEVSETVHTAPSVGPLEDTLRESMDREDERDDIVVRIMEDLPTFSGPDRDYTLKREDVVRMPRSLAAALINRRKAVEIQVRQ